MKENPKYERSKLFALEIVKLYKYLVDTKKVYVISKQLLRSGTSIGANIAESQSAQSPADFVSKLKIALKEADETLYWLELLRMMDAIDDLQFKPLYAECQAIARILTTIINKVKTANGLQYANEGRS